MLVRQIYKFDGTNIPLWVHTLFWGVYVLVFLYSFRMIFFSPRTCKPQKYFSYLIVSFFTLFAIFYCIGDDYFSYREWIYGRNFEFWNKENVYIAIVYLCRALPISYPYELFRLIVWGGAVFITYHIFRLYQGLLLPGLTLLLLFVFYSSVFCYARASLGMAVYFFGVAFYLLQDRKTLKLLGIVIAFLSFFFHHEMIIGIGLLPCLFIPFERKNFLFLSIFFLFVAICAIFFLFSNLLFLDQMFDNDDMSSKMENFSENGYGAFRLSTLVKYLNYFYPFYLLTRIFWEEDTPRSVIGMYRITYGILMASVAFMIVFGLRSVFAYRVMYISMIPTSLMIGYGYCHSYFTRKQFLTMMILSLLTGSIRFINSQ